jgi:predicted SnoaL-like aldol condensation-catalyzing enzyme
MPQARREDRDTLAGVIAAWRNGDALRAAAYFSGAGEYAEAGRSPLVGRAAIVEHFTRFFRDGPRWRLEVDEVIVGDAIACVVYRFAVEGAGASWRERAGCAIVKFDPSGAIAAWREYEG